MYHNLINNVRVPFARVVHIIVNGVKIEIRCTSDEKKKEESEEASSRIIFGETFELFLTISTYIYPRRELNLLLSIFLPLNRISNEIITRDKWN